MSDAAVDEVEVEVMAEAEAEEEGNGTMIAIVAGVIVCLCVTTVIVVVVLHMMEMLPCVTYDSKDGKGATCAATDGMEKDEGCTEKGGEKCKDLNKDKETCQGAGKGKAEGKTDIFCCTFKEAPAESKKAESF